MNSPGHGPLPPALFLVSIVAEVMLRLLVPATLPIPVLARVPGAGLLAGGLTFTVIGDSRFKRARTEISPFGRPSTLAVTRERGRLPTTAPATPRRPRAM